MCHTNFTIRAKSNRIIILPGAYIWRNKVAFVSEVAVHITPATCQPLPMAQTRPIGEKAVYSGQSTGARDRFGGQICFFKISELPGHETIRARSPWTHDFRAESIRWFPRVPGQGPRSTHRNTQLRLVRRQKGGKTAAGPPTPSTLRLIDQTLLLLEIPTAHTAVHRHIYRQSFGIFWKLRQRVNFHIYGPIYDFPIYFVDILRSFHIQTKYWTI